MTTAGSAIESVEIRQRVLDGVAAHAASEAPVECCGLLVGTPALVDESVPTTNVAASAVRFQVDPREHVRVQKALRGTGRQIVGAYHSHPSSPSTPSPTDVAQAYYPEFVYLIVSLAVPHTPQIRAYRIRSGNVTDVRLVPVP